ncbi:hypothetical protein A5N75_08185 [Prescottella equi]|nr:hypothetical protein A5N75_08185 [Prescottella equi]
MISAKFQLDHFGRRCFRSFGSSAFFVPGCTPLAFDQRGSHSPHVIGSSFLLGLSRSSASFLFAARFASDSRGKVPADRIFPSAFR